MNEIPMLQKKSLGVDVLCLIVTQSSCVAPSLRRASHKTTKKVLPPKQCDNQQIVATKIVQE